MRILLAISVIMNLLWGAWWYQNNEKRETSLVTRVIDGDTLELETKQEIRLMSVNAPEKGRCGSEEEEKKLSELAEGKRVRVEGEINDHFGRKLGLVYVGKRLINEEIILSGWARFTSTASPESERLKKAFAKIKADKIGIFSKCVRAENPMNKNCDVKGNVKDEHKIYSFKGCGSYNNMIVELDVGDQWFCSEEEAEAAGFVRAENCPKK